MIGRICASLAEFDGVHVGQDDLLPESVRGIDWLGIAGLGFRRITRSR